MKKGFGSMLMKRILAGLVAISIALAPVAPAFAANQAPIQTPTTGPHSATDFTTNYLNPALLAIWSCNWGTAAPANGPGGTPGLFECWADTTTNPVVFKYYDGASWVVFGKLDTTAHTWTPSRQGTDIGTAAIATTGSSGHTVPFLDVANTFSALQTAQGATTTLPGWYVQLTGDSVARAHLGLAANDGAELAFGPGSGARDTFLQRFAAASFRFGATDAATAVAQIMAVQNVIAGTTNTAGADWTLQGSRGTGTGAGGAIIWQVAPAGSTGSAQNALVNALKIYPSGGIGVGSGSDPGLGNINLGAGALLNNGTTPTGTGPYVRQTSAALVTPALGVATGSSLALGGCTIGADLLCVSGSLSAGAAKFSSNVAVTSAASNALAIGLNGATNPAFVVDDSTALQVAGLKVTGAVTGGTVGVVVIDSGANAGLSINAKGTGTIGIGSVSTGAVTITPNVTHSGTTTLTGALTYGGVTLSNAVTGTGNMVLGTSPTIASPTFTTSEVVPLIGPPSNSTTALRITKADLATNVMVFDTTNARVGINKTPGGFDLDVNGAMNGGSSLTLGTTISVGTGYQIGGAAASSHYLRGNGTNYVDSAILAADLPVIPTTSGSTSTSFGVVKVDGTTITANASGVLTAVGAAATAVSINTTTASGATNGHLLGATTSGCTGTTPCISDVPVVGTGNAILGAAVTPWTPTITASTTAGSPTYTVRDGHVTQEGNTITAWFDVQLSAWGGSPSGNVTITGLPTANGGAANDFGDCNVNSWLFGTAMGGVSARIAGGASAITLFGLATGGATSNVVNLTAANTGTSTVVLIGSCRYHT